MPAGRRRKLILAVGLDITICDLQFTLAAADGALDQIDPPSQIGQHGLPRDTFGLPRSAGRDEPMCCDQPLAGLASSD